MRRSDCGGLVCLRDCFFLVVRNFEKVEVILLLIVYKEIRSFFVGDYSIVMWLYFLGFEGVYMG